MTRVKLDWPLRPRKTWDRCFGAVRLTWKSKTDGYAISRCVLPDFTLVFPPWAAKRPTYHRSLAAAQRAAEAHRNSEA